MRDRFLQMLVPAVVLLALVVAVRHLHAQAKAPVPAAELQESARKAATEVYGGRFKQTKTTAEKTALATEMIEAATKVQDGSPDQYVLLYFRGIIDEVAVFRRALSEQEIQWLLQLGVQGEPLVKAGRTRSGR